MKIIIVKNNFKKKTKLQKYAVDWFKENTELVPEIIKEIDTNFPVSYRPVGNVKYHGVVLDNYYGELRKVIKENDCDIVVLLDGNKSKGIRLAIAENVPLYPNTDVIQLKKYDDDGLELNHEMFHIFFKRLARMGVFLNDCMDIALVGGVPKPYYNDKNIRAKESNRTIAIEMLKPYWGMLIQQPKKTLVESIMEKITPKTTYRYFSEKEIVGLNPELVKKLDEARHIAGIPFKINSGLRNEEQNKKAGGVADSAHLSGLAVDIACTSDIDRWKIVSAFHKVGFTRIGIAKTFVHGDIDTKKTQNVIWLYK